MSQRSVGLQVGLFWELGFGEPAQPSYLRRDMERKFVCIHMAHTRVHATRLLGSVVVKQPALITILLSFRRIHEEMKSDIFCFILQTYINNSIDRDRPNCVINSGINRDIISCNDTVQYM